LEKRVDVFRGLTMSNGNAYSVNTQNGESLLTMIADARPSPFCEALSYRSGGVLCNLHSSTGLERVETWKKLPRRGIQWVDSSQPLRAGG